MGCAFSPQDETDMRKLYPIRGYLNAENNESYAYLKSIGVDWKYDPNDVHPKLHARLYRRFDTFDLDGDNKMTLKEVMFWPERMRQLVGASDEQIESMRKAVRILFGACGITDEGLCREDWVEANQVFAEAERQRRKRGEESHVAILGNAYFDVLDKDGDGTVGLDELKVMMRAFQVPQEAAYTFFDAADVDKSGRLEREEMHNLFHKFWLEKYDPQYDAIYAYKY